MYRSAPSWHSRRASLVCIIQYSKHVDVPHHQLQRFTTAPKSHIQKGPLLDALPVEILEEIFGHLFRWPSFSEQIQYRSPWKPKPTSIQERPPPAYSYTTTPLTLCHVSPRFRSTALGDSKLWSMINFRSKGCKPKHVEMMKFWLHYAGSRPLDIHIEILSCGAQDYLYARDLTQCLVDHSIRWRSVAFHLPSILTDIAFSGLRPNQVPTLETAIIDVENWRHDDLKIMVDALVSSPCLHAFDWMESFGYHLPIYHAVPWERLTSIGLHRFATLERTLEVLQWSPNLKTFQYGDMFVDLSRPLPRFSCNVASLTISPCHDMGVPLSTISFPNIHELQILDDDRPPFPEGWVGLRDMLSKVEQSKITHFSYIVPRIGYRAVSPEMEVLRSLVLPRMNRLTHLDLSLDLTDEIINFLTYTPPTTVYPNVSTPVLLSHLQSMKIGIIRSTFDGFISNMIMSRLSTQTPSRLEFVKIKVVGRIGLPKDEECFLKLRRGGMSAYLDIVPPSEGITV